MWQSSVSTAAESDLKAVHPWITSRILFHSGNPGSLRCEKLSKNCLSKCKKDDKKRACLHKGIKNFTNCMSTCSELPCLLHIFNLPMHAHLPFTTAGWLYNNILRHLVSLSATALKNTVMVILTMMMFPQRYSNLQLF